MKIHIKASLFLFIIFMVMPWTSAEAKAVESLTVHAEHSLSSPQATSSTLTLGEQTTYDNILTAMKQGEATALFPADDISYTEVGDIIQQVVDDHPAIFYYDGAKMYSNGKIEFKYTMLQAEILQKAGQLEKQANEVIANIIKPEFSDFDKVKAVHDYLILHTAYDYDHYLADSVPPLSYTSYGLLLNGVAVCDGYAKSMKLLLEKTGVETSYVTGTVNGVAHAWNLVKVNGEYFYVDATFDDPAPDTKGKVGYQYFLVSGSYLSLDHKWDINEYPAAVSNRYAYFTDFKAMVESGDYYYYSSEQDEDKLYRVKKDGTGREKVNDVRALYIAVGGDWIYFSNYSNGGYLYKVKTNGTGLVKVNNVHSIDLYRKDTTLYYTVATTNEVKQLQIASLDEKLAKFKSLGSHTNVAINKTWTVKFNQKIDISSVQNQNVYVLTENGTSIPVTLTLDATGENIKVQPENGSYQKNTKYYLFVENLQSTTGKKIKQAVVIDFNVPQ